MVLFINTSDVIGQAIVQANLYNTGSMFMTLLILILIIFAIALMFNIPFEFTSILVLPLLLTVASFYSQILTVLGVLIIYLAIILTKRFLIR